MLPGSVENQQELHNTRGPRPSWRSNYDVLPIGTWLTTRRGILLLLSCFLTFHGFGNSNAIHATFDGSLGPKVVQIIATSNKICAFFIIYMRFRELNAVRRRRSECFSSPPQWGGGELRGSKSRKHRYGKVLGPWPAGTASNVK